MRYVFPLALIALTSLVVSGSGVCSALLMYDLSVYSPEAASFGAAFSVAFGLGTGVGMFVGWLVFGEKE